MRFKYAQPIIKDFIGKYLKGQTVICIKLAMSYKEIYLNTVPMPWPNLLTHQSLFKFSNAALNSYQLKRACK